MSKLRLILLVLGPIPILVCSWSASHWIRPANTQVAASNTLVFDLSPRSFGQPDYVAELLTSEFGDETLEAACRRQGKQIAARLGTPCRHIVRVPFVIAGDLPSETLDRWYERTIDPAARALWENYFDTRPNEPIVVLLFNGTESYDYYSHALYGDAGISIFGYYKPQQRTLVMNISTGGGTLLHELTHALADFDFPEIPDWFNEGLASLHEQARLTDDPPRIEGLHNWRLPVLRDAIERDRLRTLEELTAGEDFRGTDEGVNYAQARYFCLYMQQQGLLRDYYRMFHASRSQDPTGTATVLEAFNGQSWEQLDAGFRQWVVELETPQQDG